MTPRLLGVVQARMGSGRLPGKVLRRLGAHTVLGRVVRAAQASGVLSALVVATTTAPADDAVAAEARRLGVAVHRGPDADVLTRFIGALDAHPADAVVRFTADCPLLDPALIAATARCFAALSTVDYLSTAIVRCLPRGLDVEVAAATALRRADRRATGHHRAHVTSYLWSRPETFRVAGLTLTPDRSHLRLTLDTEPDWALLTAVVDQLGDEPAALDRLVALLDARPDLVALNAAVRQKELVEG